MQHLRSNVCSKNLEENVDLELDNIARQHYFIYLCKQQHNNPV